MSKANYFMYGWEIQTFCQEPYRLLSLIKNTPKEIIEHWSAVFKFAIKEAQFRYENRSVIDNIQLCQGFLWLIPFIHSGQPIATLASVESYENLDTLQVVFEKGKQRSWVDQQTTQMFRNHLDNLISKLQSFKKEIFTHPCNYHPRSLVKYLVKGTHSPEFIDLMIEKIQHALDISGDSLALLSHSELEVSKQICQIQYIRFYLKDALNWVDNPQQIAEIEFIRNIIRNAIIFYSINSNEIISESRSLQQYVLLQLKCFNALLRLLHDLQISNPHLIKFKNWLKLKKWVGQLVIGELIMVVPDIRILNIIIEYFYCYELKRPATLRLQKSTADENGFVASFIGKNEISMVKTYHLATNVFGEEQKCRKPTIMMFGSDRKRRLKGSVSLTAHPLFLNCPPAKSKKRKQPEPDQKETHDYGSVQGYS